MLSVLDGEVNRSWSWTGSDGAEHSVVLYHDTLSGVRCCTLDHEELPGSMGTSSVLSASHTIPFRCGSDDGVVLILRQGYLGFAYECRVRGKRVKEANEGVLQTTPSQEYAVSLTGATKAASGSGGSLVVWYCMSVARNVDGVETHVHRRYSDFVALNDVMAGALKGHAAGTLMPKLPAKSLKFAVDHMDPAFIEQRRVALGRYIEHLVTIPHVASSPSMHSFLGIHESAQEFSLVVTTPSLGCTLQRSRDPATPALVAGVKPGFEGSGLRPGDVVSKINGCSTCDIAFKDVVTMIKVAPRPAVVHFLRLIVPPAEHASEGKTNAAAGLPAGGKDELEVEYIGEDEKEGEEEEEKEAPAPAPAPLMAAQGGTALEEKAPARRG